MYYNSANSTHLKIPKKHSKNRNGVSRLKDLSACVERVQQLLICGCLSGNLIYKLLSLWSVESPVIDFQCLCAGCMPSRSIESASSLLQARRARRRWLPSAEFTPLRLPLHQHLFIGRQCCETSQESCFCWWQVQRVHSCRHDDSTQEFVVMTRRIICNDAASF